MAVTVKRTLPGDLEKLFSHVYVGKRTWEDILPAINSALKLSLTIDEWDALWCQIIKAEVPGMQQVLSELKKCFRLVAPPNSSAKPARNWAGKSAAFCACG